MSALLDSRATGMFINQSFMQKHQLETTLLPQPILVCNIDSSPNENGSVTEEVHITLHNLEVDWVSQKVSMMQCPPSCNGHVPPKSDLPLQKPATLPPFR